MAAQKTMNPQDVNQIRQLLKGNRLEDALQLSESLCASSPDNVEALTLAAMVYRQMNKRLKVVEIMHKVTSLESDNKSLWVAYSNDLTKVGCVQEAEMALNRIRPEQLNDPDVRLQQSKIHYHRREFEAATDILVNLVKRQQGFVRAHMELAHVLLMRGKWRAGWLEYESRYHLPATRSLLPKFRVPHWDGNKLNDPILLIAEQGYGDCFQFGRFIPMVAKRCNKVILIRSEPLARILDTVPGISENYTRWEDVPRVSAYSTLSGLPRLFSTRPDNIPACQGLLRVDVDDEARWAKKINEAAPKARLRIGIAWSGRVEFGDNFLRSLPIDALKPLLDVAETCFFSLQVGPLAAQADELGIINMTAELTDFAETAAKMQALDLIITSDTAVAHLACTLGRPAWILLSYAPDWRWGPDSCRSAWYPSAHLFRQDQSRSWDDVIGTVKDGLQEIVAQPNVEKALSTYMAVNKQNSR